MSLLPLIIVNPASAGGATGAAWPGLASEVRRHFGPFEVAFTRRGGEAEEIAEREARGGRARVRLWGGGDEQRGGARDPLRSGAGGRRRVAGRRGGRVLGLTINHHAARRRPA